MCDRGRSHSKVPGRCRACSTAERTATNIVIAPIARVHCAAPHTPAPCSCSHCSLLALLALVLPAPHSCCLPSLLLLPAPCSCSSCSCPCSLLFTPACAAHSRAHAPFARSSLRSQLPFRLWRCSQTFLSTTCARYSIFRLCFSALSLAPWTLPLLV